MKKTYIPAGISILLWPTLATVSKLLLGTMSSFQKLWFSAAFAAAVLLIYNLAVGKWPVMKSYRWKGY